MKKVLIAVSFIVLAFAIPYIVFGQEQEAEKKLQDVDFWKYKYLTSQMEKLGVQYQGIKSEYDRAFNEDKRTKEIVAEYLRHEKDVKSLKDKFFKDSGIDDKDFNKYHINTDTGVLEENAPAPIVDQK